MQDRRKDDRSVSNVETGPIMHLYESVGFLS